MKPNFHLPALEPFEQLVREATHLGYAILDHVYVKMYNVYSSLTMMLLKF